MLEKLQKEPAIVFRDTSQHGAEVLFSSLKSLLKPQEFILIKNTAVLEESEIIDKEFKFSGLPQKWNHYDDKSTLCLSRNANQGLDADYYIGFKWPSNVDLNSIHNHLNKLKLDRKKPSDKSHSYEKIANRISQVRDAIRSMQDMRTFISKGFEEIPNAVIVTDPLGIIVFSNSHANDWFKENSTLTGISIYTLFDSNEFDTLKEKMGMSLMKGEHLNVEVKLNEKDILIHCSPFVVDEKSDSGLMLTFSDITSIREQQREKNQLIDFLSHDVRSPLVSQLAMLNTLANKYDGLDQSTLDKLASHAKRSLNLSDQFLQITRAEQASEQQFYEFDIINAIENSIDSISAQAYEKNITINFEELDPIWIKGNAELIERMVTNLLSNSIKYSPENTTILIKLAPQNEHLTITITDQGYGIEKHELPHIFNRFHRQKNSEVSGNKGAGLGLNFVKVVIEKHNGDISVSSLKDKGSIFTINLPTSA